VANAVSDGLDQVSSERTVHLELLLRGKKYLSVERNLAQAQLDERLAAVTQPG
jgi:hypothetical protein